MKNSSFYQNLAVWLAVTIGALLLYAAVRFLLSRLSPVKEKGKRPLAARVTLPFVFVLVCFLVKQTVTLGPVYTTYVDAAFIFFAFFFIIRLIDAAVYGWYARTRKTFPLPDVLRSIGLGVLYTIENDMGPDDANHAQDGIFIMHDPQQQAGSPVKLDGLNIIDIAPTVLKLLGLPVPADMEGKAIQ